MQMPPKQTPWGEYQKIQEMIPGVFRVWTAAHGGYWLTPERMAEMPAVLRDGPKDAASEQPFNPNETRDGWFEEDDEALRVVVAFCRDWEAGAWPDGTEATARARLERDYPVTVAALVGAGFFKPRAASAFPSIALGGAKPADDQG